MCFNGSGLNGSGLIWESKKRVTTACHEIFLGTNLLAGHYSLGFDYI